MNNYQKILCGLSLMFSLLGCDNRDYEYQQKTAALQSRNIPAEVKANIAKGDKKLRVCNGAGAAFIPGLDVYETVDSVQPLIQKYGITSMDDVSDVVHGGEHGKYIMAAHEYAKLYNIFLLQELGEDFKK